MPELPEVETWRRLADQSALGKRIHRARATDDRKIFDRNAPAAVSRALNGLKIVGTERRGKHLWLRFDAPGHLYLHFGMTGSLRALDPDEPGPSHQKLELRFEDHTRLVYRNMRRIGKVRWLPDVPAVPPVSSLGPDPLLDPQFSPEWLYTRLHHRKSTLKGALLNQTLFAGVGNWIADEVLYQSRLAPARRCRDLDEHHVRRLHRALKHILHTAVEAEADAARFPRTWLFHHRWGQKAQTTARGEPIVFEQIGGRTTAWVPSRQA